MARKESKRQRQVSEMIRRNMSLVLQQEGSYIYGSALVTVTNVILTPDLLLAKIYLSVYNTENKQAVILMMSEERPRLQKALSQRIRKQIRRVPQIAFYEDDTLDEMFKVTNLFKKLDDENQMGKDREEVEED